MFHLAVRDIQHISFCFKHTFLIVNTHSAYYFTILPADGNVTIISPPLLLIAYIVFASYTNLKYLDKNYEFSLVTKNLKQWLSLN